MIDIEKVWSSDKKLKIATGLNVSEAESIFQDFELELNKVRRKKNPNSTVGRKPKLTSKEIFLMLLIFIRQYPTFEFLSLIFEIDAANIKRWIDDSYMALGEVLVKKNFALLLQIDNQRLSESNLSNSEKFILMELNNLYEDQKTT